MYYVIGSVLRDGLCTMSHYVILVVLSSNRWVTLCDVMYFCVILGGRLESDLKNSCTYFENGVRLNYVTSVGDVGVTM